jgi:hypothetical protein
MIGRAMTGQAMIGQGMFDESLIHSGMIHRKLIPLGLCRHNGKFALRNSDTVNSLDDSSFCRFSPHQ